MTEYKLAHLRDDDVVRDLAALVTRDRTSTAMLLAYVAELDARKLHVPAGYPSMFAYCTEELHMSEDVACKRIAAARAARKFPVLYHAISEGHLHVSGVTVLAPHLTTENVDELIKAATHLKKSEIEEMIARRSAPAEFATSIRPSVPATIRPLPAMTSGALSAPGRMAVKNLPLLETLQERPSSDVESRPPQPVQEPAPAKERFLVQFAIERDERDLLHHAQALLSHAVPSADVKQVFIRALRFYATHLEKRKFATGTRQRRLAAGKPQRWPANGIPSARRDRHVPAEVRCAVWKRDGGRCTFVSRSGKRCESRTFLEFDHVDPVARGGTATVERTRIRCRVHNQYEAERVFGVGFMNQKRHEARIAREKARERTPST